MRLCTSLYAGLLYGKIKALKGDYKTFVSLVDSIICIAKNNLAIAGD